MASPIKFTAVSLPASVIVGEYFTISVGVENIALLYDNTGSIIVDSENSVLIPQGDEHVSAYSGLEIDNFITEVLS